MNLENSYTVEDLLEGCKRGERKTQEMLYRKLASKMFNVCLRYASNTFEAEDMLQTGFIKVFSSIVEFRSEGSFEGWIRRIMVNNAIEICRKNIKRCHMLDIEAVPDQVQHTFDMGGLEVKDLMRLIQQLPDGYRLVFNMYAIEGYSHKEIADMLKISEGASKSQLSRARAWLKGKLIVIEGGNNYGTYAG
ncbi:RNA polymerase sigma factor [Olivibacter sp. SDN3]|uniref:RNA polymerase sigma factor n=1 Tax=Olivibacter sp. SDN3 TaxID=2764720 RepID=UPI00165178CE|nr:RNA polymerase sigma factor [Olivibacter sp. SDN3]QNL50430.1 RNA polymerase sigma factor [Olivibacter sp. SDN3]